MLETFEREQIPVIVMKGAALANRLSTDIGLRWMGNLDLLVHPEDQARVGALMLQCGYVEQ
ncbi:MAG: nucleotidyltransferase family protein [Anaerolineales bacterium]|nr:nucleotidyltransferase family protein [Anaerolineales bacterium]